MYENLKQKKEAEDRRKQEEELARFHEDYRPEKDVQKVADGKYTWQVKGGIGERGQKSYPQKIRTVTRDSYTENDGLHNFILFVAI